MRKRPCSRPTGLVRPYGETGFRKSKSSPALLYSAKTGTSRASQRNWRKVRVEAASPLSTLVTASVTTTVCRLENWGWGSTLADMTRPRTTGFALWTGWSKSAGAVYAPLCAKTEAARNRTKTSEHAGSANRTGKGRCDIENTDRVGAACRLLPNLSQQTFVSLQTSA